MADKKPPDHNCIHEADWGDQRAQTAHLRQLLTELKAENVEIQQRLNVREVTIALIERTMDSVKETQATVTTKTGEQIVDIRDDLLNRVSDASMRIAELEKKYRDELVRVIDETTRKLLVEYVKVTVVSDEVAKHIANVELSYKKKIRLIIGTISVLMVGFGIITKVIPLSAIINYFTSLPSP